MENKEITPVFTGDTIASEHGTLYPEVISLDGNVRLRLQLASGEEIILPYEILPLVGQNSLRMQSALKNYLEEARFEEYKPSKRHSQDTLVARRKSGRNGTNIFSLPNAELSEDATPYIIWRTNESGLHGWALTMAGIDEVTLGWAAWNDPAGVDELISNLSDVDSCLAIAGIVAAAETAQMSARITAKALRSGRKLPGINVAKIKKIFEGSQLTTPSEISDWNAAQIKTLAIDSGNRKVPVAVAISAPSKFVGQESISDEEARNMTWQQRRQAEQDLLQPLVDEWVAKAKELTLAAGWRIIDLPIPRSYYHNLGANSTFWVTLINPELWSNVSAAAQESARNFRMSRTSRI